MADQAKEEERLREARGIAVLWFALLAAPVAWMLGLNADYGMVRVACAGNTALPLHLVTLATLVLAAGGGWVARREWRRLGAGPPDEEPGAVGRSRFMAAVGMLASALFSLAIVSQWLAKVFLHPCMGI